MEHTEQGTYPFHLKGQDRGEYDEALVYVTDHNPWHVVGAVVWTGVD